MSIEGFRSTKRMRYVTAKILKDRLVVPEDTKKQPNVCCMRGVLEYLADNCDNETLTIVRTQERISTDTGWSERMVREALSWLSRMGIIDRRHRWDPNRNKRTSDVTHLRLFEDDVWTLWLAGESVEVPAQDAANKPAHDAGHKSFTTDQISTTDDSLRSSSGATCGDMEDAMDEQTSIDGDGQLVPRVQEVREVVVADRRKRVAGKADELLRSGKQFTVNQRATLMASVYYEAVDGMTNHIATMQICKTAIQAGRWTDREICTALWRLAEEGRPVSKASLMVALNGGIKTKFEAENEARRKMLEQVVENGREMTRTGQRIDLGNGVVW